MDETDAERQDREREELRQHALLQTPKNIVDMNMADEAYEGRIDALRANKLIGMYATRLQGLGVITQRATAIETASLEFERLKTNEDDWKEFVRRCNATDNGKAAAANPAKPAREISFAQGLDLGGSASLPIKRTLDD